MLLASKWLVSRTRAATALLQSHRRLLSVTAIARDDLPKPQSVSRYAPVGVTAALETALTGSTTATPPTKPPTQPKAKIFAEFSLPDRVAIVSGANRGLGLEAAMALAEQGAKAVYCLDRPKEPSSEFLAVRDYVARLSRPGLEDDSGPTRLEYVSADVTDQAAMWDIGEEIGKKEGRVDVCVAAAGILRNHIDCLEYPRKEFEEVMNVNTNGVLYTAQAAGRQMLKYGTGGSIILIASMSGSITNRDHNWVSYNTSKSAVLQMARSMACEVSSKGIRVNSVSPGHIYTQMTAAYLSTVPGLLEKWSSLNPTGRIGRPDEIRGVIAWLASDASSFCTGSDIIVDGGHRAW